MSVRDPKDASNRFSPNSGNQPLPPIRRTALCSSTMAVGPTADGGNATKPTAAAAEQPAPTDAPAKRLPRGIVLGPDGKPYARALSLRLTKLR